MSWGLNSAIAILCQLSAGFTHFGFPVSVQLNYLQPANEVYLYFLCDSEE